ncbi:hypothetical protein RJ640_012525 [Escallonia rubra]|uniref:Tf2-1-like SH3-like domain-containing protein n=1 Tax=Escallonia rubra TaxID=112253 RepID=A0AA88QUK1_9ASTE|nr:hypothetical protein RJ640_012525 [Escallonia rubra]
MWDAIKVGGISTRQRCPRQRWRNPWAKQVAKSRNEKTCLACKHDKAEEHTRRQPRDYNLGDLVMVKTLRKVHKGFVPRCEGPFLVVAKFGKASYKLKLPPKSKIHPVFHTSLLKPHHVGVEDHDRGKSRRAPTAEVKSYHKGAEYVLSGEAQLKARDIDVDLLNAFALLFKYTGVLKALVAIPKVHEKEFLLEDLTTEGLLGEERRLGECVFSIKTIVNVASSHGVWRLQSSEEIMEKCKSFPDYSYSQIEIEARFGFEDRTKSYSFNGQGDNPEVKRRKRVASYNMYSMEGKLKSSFRNSFKWIKNKFTDKCYDSS